MEILVGETATVGSLSELPLRDTKECRGRPKHDLLVLVPYRQITERGFDCHDDGTPLTALSIQAQSAVPVDTVFRALPDRPVRLAADAGFDTEDAEYAATVQQIVSEEIGNGEGANFVIRRSFAGTVAGRPIDAALTVFRRLLATETDAYWTFLIFTGSRILVGASPEGHVTLDAGNVLMNPISGTLRHSPSGVTLPTVLEFLTDRKEIDELYMVVDEELKMMSRFCEPGVQVIGPGLKEMSRLTHTEYTLTGRSRRDVREILRETMFVPTVTGSPLENACRVIKRYEPNGRGYYSGVLALIGQDGEGLPTLDSTVLIRTAELDGAGALRVGVGATLVRHSNPASEVAETRAKAAAVVGALTNDVASPAVEPRRPEAPSPPLAGHPDVRKLLERRNQALSRFWLQPPGPRVYTRPELAGRSALVLDSADTFTAMLGHQLAALGTDVVVRRYDEPFETAGFDVVIVGPGPGDPRQSKHPKMHVLRSTVRRLLDENRPFLAVCLGHQILCDVLGLPIVRKAAPNQGLQLDIPFLGVRTRVGFYNTFVALSQTDRLPDDVIVVRDPATCEVHALHGRRFSSTQFHPESVLTEHGVDILGDLLTLALKP